MTLGCHYPILRHGQIVSHRLLNWQSENMIFSECFVVYDLNVGRYRQLIELMKLVSIQGQGHFCQTLFFKGLISGERSHNKWSSG